MKAKKKQKKYEELWRKMRHLTKPITKNSDDYYEKQMKINVNLDDELPLNKTIETPTITKLFYMKIINIIHKFS